VDAHALPAGVAGRAVDARARVDAPGHPHRVDLADLPRRALRLGARVGDAQTSLVVADVATRAGELAAAAGRDAGALVAHGAVRAVAVGVGVAAAVGGDAVALVGHRQHLALADDGAIGARGDAGVARRLHLARRQRDARRPADDADLRIARLR